MWCGGWGSSRGCGDGRCGVVGGVAVEGVGDGRCGVVGGVAVEGVVMGGVVSGWAGGYALHLVCMHVPFSVHCLVHFLYCASHSCTLNLPHMMYSRGLYPR